MRNSKKKLASKYFRRRVIAIICGIILLSALALTLLSFSGLLTNKSSSGSSAVQQSSSFIESLPESAIEPFVPEAVGPYDEEGIPMLINRDNMLPEGYAPELTTASGNMQLTPMAAAAYSDMYVAAANVGYGLFIVSGYRSHETQKTNFEVMYQGYLDKGNSEEDAFYLTARYIAVPGSSEHEAGLAVDLNSLTSFFDETAEFEWLKENCAKFGFIMRYAKDTEHITNIAYEPWHFRYVGSNHATAIEKLGVTLEKYVAMMKGEAFVEPEPFS